MIIEPKIRGFICTTAHPIGCKQHVLEQMHYVGQQPRIGMPKRILIIGSSTGYGLATRIASFVAGQAATIGVALEKEGDEKRTASPGWYNTAAFEEIAKKNSIFAKTIMGDAFATETKERTIHLIKNTLEQIDLVVYSLASPRRTDPETGQIYQSVLKTCNDPFHSKTVNAMTGVVSDVTIEPAQAEEITQTIAVMGGADWQLWIDALLKANVLASKAMTVAYSYIGPELTYPIYHHGTIGQAKHNLHKTANQLNELLAQQLGGRALVSVNKAVVTQASAAIPVVPLYLALLFRIMKAKNIHEGCIEQIYRLLQNLYNPQNPISCDASGLIRLDDLELRDDVQTEIKKYWNMITTDNLTELTDIAGYRKDFHRLFGFGFNDVNYQQEVETQIPIEIV